MIEYFRLNIEYLRNSIILNKLDTLILGFLGSRAGLRARWNRPIATLRVVWSARRPTLMFRPTAALTPETKASEHRKPYTAYYEKTDRNP